MLVARAMFFCGEGEEFMDASMVSAASNATDGSVQGLASIMMLRKSMDIQAQGAMTLLEALPAVPSNNPAHLGQNVDVKA
ncbi:YjfB family protein [Chitinibacter sp. S2-10]|uniref:YjfB family protein n=1 Tax=Chitinibacter sp. S2-10 TaxID=3373597 RepID=UPI0039775C7F